MISLRPACGRLSDARIRGFVVQSADQFYPVLACADALQGVSFVIAVLTGIAESPTSAGQPDPIVLIRQCVDTMAPLRCARVRSGPAGHRGAWLICSGSTSCSAQCVLRTSRNHGSRNGNRAGRSRASHRNITPGSVKGHRFLPTRGHETCPLVATVSAHRWPRNCPPGFGVVGRAPGGW